MKKNILSSVVVLSVILSQAGFANSIGKLDFTSSGLYGGWNEYFVDANTPFDFLIVQCWVSSDNASWHGKGKSKASWNDWLGRAYKNGKRVIMDLNPVVTKNKKGISLQHTYSHSNKVTAKEFEKIIDSFLPKIDLEKLYAITLAEENVYWSGQAKLLNELYSHIKQKYPKLRIFQWYTPGADVAGFGWPNLKADGWVIDEYFLDNPKFEYFVRGYVLKKLPLISIIWAGPDCKDVPYKERRFWSQYRICRKYNVPAAYFVWTGKGNIWGWSENPPTKTKQVFELCKYVAKLSKECPARCQDWDFVTYKPPVIALCCDTSGKPIASYREIFNKKSGVRFLKDAKISGFANLYWNSSPLKLYSLSKGRASSVLSYTFKSPFKLKALQISLKGRVKKELKGFIGISIFDIDENKIAQFSLTNGEINQIVPVGEIKDNKFVIKITLSGQASEAKQVPAEIDEFEVIGKVTLPKDKAIKLIPDALGNVEYSDDFGSLSIIHTAVIKNRKELIVRRSLFQLSGTKGYTNRAEIVQKFICDKPVKLEYIMCKGTADPAHYASSFGIGISLDGRNVIKKITSKSEKDKNLIIKLKDVFSQKAVKQF